MKVSANFSKNRLVFFDNLRFLIVVFVVLQHSGNAYSNLGWWPVVATLVVLAPLAAGAGGTRLWELAGYAELDNGEAEGTVVTSRGEVRRGLKAVQVDLADTGLVSDDADPMRSKMIGGTDAGEHQQFR